MPDLPDEVREKLKDLGTEAAEIFKRHLGPVFDNAAKDSAPFLSMLAQEIVDDHVRLLTTTDPGQKAVIEQSIALRIGTAELRAKGDGLLFVRASAASAKETLEKVLGVAGDLLKGLIRRVIPIP